MNMEIRSFKIETRIEYDPTTRTISVAQCGCGFSATLPEAEPEPNDLTIEMAAMVLLLPLVAKFAGGGGLLADLVDLDALDELNRRMEDRQASRGQNELG